MVFPAVAAGTAAATVPKSVFSDAVSVSGDEVEYSTTKDRLHPSISVHKLLHLSDLGFKSANLPNTYNQDGEVKSRTGQTYSRFIGEDDCVLVNIVRTPRTSATSPELAYHRAGPREKLHFEPKEVRAAIVNCGGLCPGLNDVIHHIVEQLYYVYGVKDIYGIRGGYRGFDSTVPLPSSEGGGFLSRFMTRRSLDSQSASSSSSSSGGSGGDGSSFFAPMLLSPKMVSNWHHEGGTNLGSARGGFDESKRIQINN